MADPYEVDGGWVTIGSDGSGVYLESASPKPGWSITVENQGPEEVVVVFKAKEEETHFVAQFTKGQVKIQIEDSTTRRGTLTLTETEHHDTGRPWIHGAGRFCAVSPMRFGK